MGDFHYNGFTAGPEEENREERSMDVGEQNAVVVADRTANTEPVEISQEPEQAGEFMAKTIENMQACLQCLVEIKDGNDERLHNLETTMQEMVEEHRTEMLALRNKMEGMEKEIRDIDECNKRREERFRSAFNDTKEQIDEQEDRMKGILLVISESIYNQEQRLKEEAAAVDKAVEQDAEEKKKMLMEVQNDQQEQEWKRKEIQAEMQQQLQEDLLENRKPEKREVKQLAPPPFPPPPPPLKQEQKTILLPWIPPTPPQRIQQTQQQQQLLELEQQLLQQEQLEQHQQEEQQRQQQQLLRQQLQLHLLLQREREQKEREEEVEKEKIQKQLKKKEEEEELERLHRVEQRSAERNLKTSKTVFNFEEEHIKKVEKKDESLPIEWTTDEDGIDTLQMPEYVNGQIMKTTPRKFAEIAFHNEPEEEKVEVEVKRIVVEEPVVKVDLHAGAKTFAFPAKEFSAEEGSWDEPIYAKVFEETPGGEELISGTDDYSLKSAKKSPPPVKEKPQMSKIPVIRPPSVLYDKSWSREEKKSITSPTENVPDLPPRNPFIQSDAEAPSRRTEETKEEESNSKEKNLTGFPNATTNAKSTVADNTDSDPPETDTNTNNVELNQITAQTNPNKNTETSAPTHSPDNEEDSPSLKPGITINSLATMIRNPSDDGNVDVAEQERSTGEAYPYRGEFVIRREDRSAYRKMKKKTIS